jgi:hypothetical protein
MGLRLSPISLSDACTHVRHWHRHNPAIQGGIVAQCVVDEHGWPQGVAIMGRPVSRVLQERGYLEVGRVATTGARNACSMLYGWAAREARRRGAQGLVTYIRADEPGTTVRAAGWLHTHTTKPAKNPWQNRPGRAAQESIAKTRWEPQWSAEYTRRLAQGDEQ